MAFYAALASLMELLDDSLHHHQFQDFLLDRHQPMKSLHQKFSLLLDSLQDYSSKGDEAASGVERRITDAAYLAQDVIDFESGSVEFKEHLQKLEREVDSIVEEVKAVKESQRSEDTRQDYDAAADTSASEQAPTASDRTVGFEKYLEQTKKQLCGDPSSKLQVIPIVGMGGIGKTTLAKTIFEDSLIKDKFGFRGWVAISQNFDVIRVLQNILKSLEKSEEGKKILEEEEERERKEKEQDSEERERKKKEREKRKKETEEETREREKKEEEERERKRKELEAETQEQKLEREKKELEERRRKMIIALTVHIYKVLTGRRYLVVIDDIWNDEAWDNIKCIFPDNHNGSRILLTTRSSDVAKYASTSDSLSMQTLPTDESWNLLKERVFGSGECPSNLEVIGKSIAEKCRGLPLAIVVIAGILSTDKTPQHWKIVARDVGSVLSREDEHLLKILSLSYNHLPHPLKACFLHIGSFPEDYDISISKLIRLWIAEGFLRSSTNSKSLEEIGEEYLEELVKRSLVIITKKTANGHFKSCGIHDLLRDLCLQQGRRESFFQDTEQEGQKVRRIIIDSVDTYMPREHDAGKYVRSICSYSKNIFSGVRNLELGSVELLRILDVADAETFLAPFAVSQTFHLKYLAVRLGRIKKRIIPPSISKFQFLQTLIILAPECVSISLPSEIWKMPRLRHVIVDKMILPPIAPDGDMQTLKYLQTLETVEGFIFTSEATRVIANIGKLKLSFRGDRRATAMWELYSLDNLVHLEGLEKLNITFHAVQISCIHSFPSSFLFPKNLKKLSLEGCRFPWEELTVVGSLKHLEVLRLKRDALVGDKWEPVEEEFPKLKFLLMESLDLKHWTAEKTCFERLEHLKINKCSDLEEIPSEIGDIDTLKFITVYDSKLAGDSAKKILEAQWDNANDELQVIVRDYGIEHFEDKLTEMSKHSKDEGTM